LKERTAVEQWDRDPNKILRDAVKGMLPKNKTQVRLHTCPPASNRHRRRHRQQRRECVLVRRRCTAWRS
jgi:ribosomal protein L13